MNRIIFIIYIFINISCNNKNNNTITWYEKETIRSINKIDENTFKIEIGISSQIFYFDIKNGTKKIYNVLNYSLENNQNIKIGIEQNTNKILFAQKLNKK